MAAMDFVCPDLAKHLKKSLNLDSQNDGISMKQRKKPRNRKKNLKNISAESPDLATAVTYKGKEIVDLVPGQNDNRVNKVSPLPKINRSQSDQLCREELTPTNDFTKQHQSKLNKIKKKENKNQHNPEQNPEPHQSGAVKNEENNDDSRGFNRSRCNEQADQAYEEECSELAEYSTKFGKQGQSKGKRNRRKAYGKQNSLELDSEQSPIRLTVEELVQLVDEQDDYAGDDFDTNKAIPSKVKKERSRKNKSQKYKSRNEMQLWNNIELTKQFQEDFENEVKSISPELRKRLQSEYIFPLEKMSFKFPEAIFFCHVCRYHCSMKEYPSHIEGKNHETLKNIRDEEYFLKNIPYPSEAHCSALTELLKETANYHGLTLADLEERQTVAKRLNQLIQENGLDDCELQIYGSSLTGFGINSSDLNLDLNYSSSKSISVILVELMTILKECDDLTDVVTVFEAKVPKISFKDKNANLNCEITWRNVDSVRTSQLLCRYRELDPRVHMLGAAFKYWANLCEIDNAGNGTLPSHAYTIMLIYFLQQVQPPVLPVLHEIDPNVDLDNPTTVQKIEIWKSRAKNKKSIGELWVDLLQFYGVKFQHTSHIVCIRCKKVVSRSERKWSGSVIAIEDPYSPKRNLSRIVSNPAVYSYIQTKLRSCYRYFAVPQTTEGPLYTKLDTKILKHDKDVENASQSLESSDLSSCEDCDAEDGDWKRRRRRRRRNTSEISRDTEDFEEDNSSNNEEELLEDNDPDISLDDLRHIENLNLGNSGDDQKFRTESESSDVNPHLMTSGQKSISVSPAKKITAASRSSEKVSQKSHSNSLQEPVLFFSFDKDILTDKKSPPLYCGECGEEGHLQDDCLSLCLPVLKDFSPLPSSYLKLLDEACFQVMQQNAPSKPEVAHRKALLDDLESYIQLFYPGAKLELFGSSCNGFGFAGSDMDMCLTFPDSNEEEDLNYGEIIDNLATCLKSHDELCNVLAITTAKVPIVKFNFQKLYLDCDISLYNTLAQHNTRMLLTYCKIDQRVQLLGYTMKFFAKLCDVGDASRGSLSSYAYILMVIYYLQQRKPAVIPVLQEVYPKNQDCPQVIVDGWNAWFYDDLENLATVWPEIGQNKETVGELWIGLLRFYTEEFDFKKHVVCIRQKAVLSRIEKFWNTRMICIEDPFDLNHNLGVGVSIKMGTYIKKAFIRGRELFCTTVDDVNPDKMMDHWFNKEKLMIEAPPNDRGCRGCGKIGHKVKDCPKYGRFRNSKNKRKQQEQSQDVRRRQNWKGRGSKRKETDVQTETARSPEIVKTREEKPRRPRIEMNSRLMQSIKNFVESGQRSNLQRGHFNT